MDGVTAFLSVALVAAVGGLVPLVLALRKQRHAFEALSRQTTQLQDMLAAPTMTQEMRASNPAVTDRAVYDQMLVDHLRLVRDAFQARHATFWRRGPDGQVTVAASSTGTAMAMPTDGARIAEWADAEGITTVVDDDPGGPLAAAQVPPMLEGGVRGALVVRGAGTWPKGRVSCREHLEEYAQMFSRLVAMLETRRTVDRQQEVLQAMLNLLRHFSRHRNAEGLGLRICETATAIVGAQRAALIRWEAARAAGRVVAASPGHDLQAGQAVSADSLVAEACLEGKLVMLQASAAAGRSAPIFSPDEPAWTFGSLVAVPLLRDRAVLGAIVVEATRSGALREQAVSYLRLLADVTVPPLEATWDYEEVERRARTDVLTGLWNRRHFEGELERCLRETDRYGGTVSVVLCDVDHFKKVNDTWGHETGDDVLRHVAQVLRDGARTVDVVARLGGEEFALLLPATGVTGATEVAERLRAALVQRPPSFPDGTSQPVTASFGVAAYPAPIARRDALVGAADGALYASKRDGRNRVTVSSGLVGG